MTLIEDMALVKEALNKANGGFSMEDSARIFVSLLRVEKVILGVEAATMKKAPKSPEPIPQIKEDTDHPNVVKK